MYSPASAGTAKIVATNRSGSSCNETLKLNSSNVQSFCNETLKLHSTSPLWHAASTMFEHLTLTSGLPPRHSTAWLSFGSDTRRLKKVSKVHVDRCQQYNTCDRCLQARSYWCFARKKWSWRLIPEMVRIRRTVKMAINLLPQQHGGTHYEWLFGHSTPIQARATQHGLACSTPAMPDRLLIPAGSGKH
nr:plexin-B-like [Rhipicephalus microplus]